MPSATDASESGEGVPEGAHGQGADTLLRGVQSFHRESGFGKLFRFKYTDSEISPERKTVLNDLRTMYESALALQLTTGIDPLLSNGFGAHKAGTVGQGKSGAGTTPVPAPTSLATRSASTRRATRRTGSAASSRSLQTEVSPYTTS